VSVLDGLSEKKKEALKKRREKRLNRLIREFNLDKEKLFGEAWEKSLKFIKEECQSRVLTNDDCAILVTGDTGVGKTSYCLNLAYHLSPQFHFETNVSLLAEDRFNQTINLTPGSVHVAEEAELEGHRMSYRTTEGINFKHLFQTNRKKKIIHILNLPDITDIIDYIFDRRVRIWIHILERGLGMVFIAQDGLFLANHFGIDLKELKKLTKFIKSEKDTITLIRKYFKKRPSWKGFIGIPAFYGRFTPEIYDKYEEWIIEVLDKFYKEKRDYKGGRMQQLKAIIVTMITNLIERHDFQVGDILNLVTPRGSDRPLMSQKSIYRYANEGGVQFRKTNVEKAVIDESLPVIE
jgi:hypothetical protein